MPNPDRNQDRWGPICPPLLRPLTSLRPPPPSPPCPLPPLPSLSSRDPSSPPQPLPGHSSHSHPDSLNPQRARMQYPPGRHGGSPHRNLRSSGWPSGWGPRQGLLLPSNGLQGEPAQAPPGVWCLSFSLSLVFFFLLFVSERGGTQKIPTPSHSCQLNGGTGSPPLQERSDALSYRPTAPSMSLRGGGQKQTPQGCLPPAHKGHMQGTLGEKSP
mmetsp:Transcript_10398/g.20164  ORF Transcript_10398/g.20164 Transcript_10398/m.20164 type:complete len:214 (-) Transcript_10398:109-750(-)